jgi:hypothetical protein
MLATCKATLDTPPRNADYNSDIKIMVTA